MYGIDLTEGGDIVDVTPVTVNTDLLQELVNEFGAAAIMAVNNGDIPKPEQIAEVRAKLEAAKQVV
jgi:hypothetical protein